MGFDPSLSNVQICTGPDRAELTAIFFPSGENCGSNSNLVEEMNFSGAVHGPSLAAAVMRKISASPIHRYVHRQDDLRRTQRANWGCSP